MLTCGRSDAVLYEMLTGRRAFEGEDVGDTLAAVLRGEPDWNALPADVPPHIRMLIQRCLAKDRRQRMADISVALFVMTEAANLAPATAGTGGPTAALPRPPLWRRLVMPTAVGHRGLVPRLATAVWLAMRPSGPARHAFRPLSNGCGGVVRGPSISRPRDHAGRHAHRL